MPAENGQFVRMAYTYTDVPAETQYIRINFPMPTTGDTTGYKGVTLENVKFSKDAGIGALAGVTAAAKGTDGLTASWEALTTDKNIEYVVAVDGKQAAKVGKDQTSYDISGLEEQTEYKVQVYAIETNAAENSDYTAKAAESAIVKTAASANLFIDKFKFAETIDTDADNKTISHAVNFDAIGANIYRKVFEDNLTAVYDLGENIDTFEVWMQVYREKTNTPGDTTFEVSVDGVEWTPVTAVRDGSDYTSTENWVTKDWKYSASDVQTTLPGAKYLKVIFGAPCYKSNGTTKILESVRLKQVKVTTAEPTV